MVDKYSFWLLSAIMLIGAIFRLSIYNLDPLFMDSAYYASLGRSISEGDYLLQVNHMSDKPPLFFYVQALFFQLLGVSESVAVLPSFLAGIGRCLQTCSSRFAARRNLTMSASTANTAENWTKSLCLEMHTTWSDSLGPFGMVPKSLTNLCHFQAKAFHPFCALRWMNEWIYPYRVSTECFWLHRWKQG